jgi:hypothetical protein
MIWNRHQRVIAPFEEAMPAIGIGAGVRPSALMVRILP